MSGADYTVDVIAGDGIGPEVMPAAVACIDALAPALDFTVTWRDREWGSDYYRKHGRMMPVDGIDQLGTGDATLLGAVGAPDIPDDVTLWGLLIPIRREFQQYVNLRPVRILPGVVSPLAGVDSLDIVVVRENVEGEYSEIGGRLYRGRPDEMAVQEAVFTRAGIERVARYAIELAQQRRGRLVSATKSNGIIHTMPFWDEVVGECVAASSGVTVENVLIDALAARHGAATRHDRRHRRLQPLRRHPLRPGGSGRRVDRRGPERQPEPAPQVSRRCSSPSTGPLRTSPAEGSRTPSARSGPRR